MKPIILNICVGLLYFLLSRVSLMLSLTPGAVALIWPPAGLALAACLIWRGSRIWPGILIGSAFSNAAAADGQFDQSWLPWIIACGSTLQAFIAEKLLLRFAPSFKLTRPNDLLHCFAIALGTCTIAALNGSTALFIKHLIDSEQFSLTFINWWLGDTLGILIFTPLVLVTFDQSKIWNGRRWHVGIPLLIGMLFCVVIQHTMEESDEQELVTRFQSEAISMLNKFKLLEQTQTQSLIDLTALFDASEHVTAKEFKTFSQRILNNRNVFHAWGWIPLVNQKDAHNYAITKSLSNNHPIEIRPIKDWSPNSNGWSAPVTYIEPHALEDLELDLGLDLLSEPIRADAIERARQSDLPSVTSKITRSNKTSDFGGVFVFAPVHDNHGKLNGFCVGVIDFNQLIANISDNTKNLFWRIEDISTGGQLLLTNTREILPRIVKSPFVERKGIHYQATIKLADHEWRIILFQPFSTLGTERITSSLLIFFLALLMCSVFGAIALITSGNQKYITGEVMRKTQELSNEINHRSRIETHLRQSDDRFRQLFHSSPIPVAIHDTKGIIVSLNDRFIKTFGYTLDDIPDLDAWCSLAYPNEHRLTNLQLMWPDSDKSTSILNNEIITPEIRIACKDGTNRWVIAHCVFIGDERLVAFNDITTQKQDALLIHNNEQNLLNILNVSPIAVRIAISQGSKVIFYNQRYAELIRNPKPMEDNPNHYYANPKEYQEILSELKQGHIVLNRQIELCIPDDHNRTVLASYMPMHYQGNDAILGWFYDITELIDARKLLAKQLKHQLQVEETLRIANAEEHAIFDTATSGIVLIKEGIILRCNCKLEAIFGYASGELNGQSTRIWYPDDLIYETDGRPMYKAIADGKSCRLEQQLIHKNGTVFWARLSGKALDTSDQSKGLVVIIDDITQEHQATQALLKAKLMAEEATRVKSEFLANMSHEIRTPMNGVLGMLDLLSETPMSPTQLDWVKTAHSSGQSLLEIINDILDLTKLEANKFEVEHVDFNLVDLVEDVCALSANRANSKGLELNCLLPIAMPFRWQGDPMRIRQVLTNLISNAIKFTERGEVSLKIIKSFEANNPDQLRFEVHDTGIGISEDTLSRLFMPFIQAESATSRRFGGSGLGLSISKKLVELMGGSIGVNSILGTGSCFWFTLPITQTNTEDDNILRASYDLLGKRILIVDDNATNRSILNSYLTNWGLTVSETDNAGSALSQLQTSTLQGVRYDLILLDMQMPMMDGLTLAKCLKQIPGLATLPIILLSSDSRIEPTDYQDTCITQRLLKPVRHKQLYDAIIDALQLGANTNVDSPAPSINLPSYQHKKVLVVEDNKINQKVIVAKLSKFNIAPDVVENGLLALEKLELCSYDLVFMDCHMPIMDGYTASRELRLRETQQSLPHHTVIALTANALEGERQKCLAAGMDDYITKPIASKQLLDILIKYLGNGLS